jgi:hypothetical protein
MLQFGAGPINAWGRMVPITPFLKGQAFQPEVVRIMGAAFDTACRRLRLADRTDPATELVAKKVVEIVQRGERDPDRVCSGVLKAFNAGGPAP